MQNKLSTHRVIDTILLIVVCGILATLAGCQKNQPAQITILEEPELVGTVYVGGKISVPGYYPLKSRDTIEALIQAAGGTTDSADFNQIKLYISDSGKEEPQKIDLNRAEAWLLEALPEIGEILAKRIVAYREQNGLFRNINELMRVEGIGSATYDRVKGLITVSE